ncbi:MAG: hypothetical protein J0H15_10335 [Xanthomonadales bacterium]|nr:hypothetical protein [Xanthomonadales bacterium]
MSPTRSLLAIALLLLAACGSGPVRKVHPSTASIQQLAILPGGEWQLSIRIENFSTMAMHYEALDARLLIDGADAGEIHVTPDIDIVANSGDVVTAHLHSRMQLRADVDFGYRLEGSIRTTDPKASFKFERSSRLSPVPGIPNTWR